MTPLYESYLKEMKRLKASLPYMTEKQLEESLGINSDDEYHEPLVLTPRNQSSPKKPTLSAHEQMERTKQLKRIAMQKMRERNKSMGLRADGKPYKEVA